MFAWRAFLVYNKLLFHNRTAIQFEFTIQNRKNNHNNISQSINQSIEVNLISAFHDEWSEVLYCV